MADLATLERALRNADAAGDVEAARTIAAAIRDQQGKNGSMVGDMLAGVVRGAGGIGATLLTPIDAAARKLGIQNEFIGRTDRRKAMDEALRGLGADTDSWSFKGGKLASEIAGTAGVGGVLAKPLMAAAPALSAAAPRAGELLGRLGSAVSSGGFTAGSGGRPVADLALRTAGGAATGAAAAGMVNPEDAGLGAAIGGALPGVLKATGAGGAAVGSLFKGKEKKAAEELARALNLGNADDINRAVLKLRAAQELVPGAKPTVAQALQTPQGGVLQRVVSDSAGGSALRDTLAAQNQARMAALEGVAPIAPNGVATARDELGRSIIRAAQAGDSAAKQRTRDLFNQVPLDDASIYLPLDRIAGAQGKYFGAGSFGDRSAVDEAVQVAQRLGTEAVDAVRPATAGQAPASLAQAVRKAGGISIADNSGLRGEVAGLRGDLKNLVRRNGGLSPAMMAERMREAGYIADESTEALFDALRNEARGGMTYSAGDDLSRQFGAMRDASMGAAPDAGQIPKLTTLREVQNYRSALGNEARKASMQGNDRAAAALNEMRAAIDDHIDEVVRGDGMLDENLPIDWADKLSAALKSKREQVAQFRTGPQSQLFRKGRDGAPVVHGGEAASLFWGSGRPGLADDVDSFKRLIGDNPRLLGQFRSMVTTEGASTATTGGNLSNKFVRWVENTLPGLQKTFDPAEVKTLQRIAQDIKRAESAAGAGMARGSNTYQNAANALNIGLLDSPLLNMAANRIPLLGQFTGPMLEGMRNTARTTKAQQMAGLLSDAGAAADSLGGLMAPPGRAAGLLGASGDLALPWLYRAAPVLSTSP